jgi:uncharacterized protein DUF5076
MFGSRKSKNALEPPPIAETNPKAVEVLRVWAVPGEPQQLSLLTTWRDPGAWGLLLADVARHAAEAYGREGHDPKVVLTRIRQALEAEWSDSTDVPTDLSGKPS